MTLEQTPTSLPEPSVGHPVDPNLKVAPPRKATFHPQTVSRALLIAAILGVGLLPIIRMLSVILSTGMNNLSNDYVSFVPVVLKIVQHGLPIQDLASTCFRGQCEPLTYLIMAAIAKFFAWNTYVEMTFSILVLAACTVLITLIFTGFTLSPRKLWVFIFVSAITLSISQIASISFGQASIYPATTLFGLCLSLFGYRFFPDSVRGVLLVVLGMWISIWSYGAGVLVIPIILVCLLFRFRRVRYFAIWLAVLLFSGFPYLEYYLNGQAGASQLSGTLVSLYRPNYIIRLLGLFFSNNIGSGTVRVNDFVPPHPSLVGILGLLSLLPVLLYLTKRNRWAVIGRLLPSFGLVAFGIASVWEISLVRPGVAPWYIIDSAPFWLGLIGLFFAYLTSETLDWKTVSIFMKSISGIFLFGVGILWVNSNLTYADKVLHLYSRAPASAACLRYYQEAPTFCEGLLFAWGIGRVGYIQELASPLAENQLSVFGPSQVKTLQGEYLFDNKVRVNGPSAAISWWAGLDGAVSRWDDYEHLDILIPAPQSVVWTVDIPQNSLAATLRTGVGINTHYQPASLDAGDQANVKIVITADGVPAKTIFEKNILPGRHAWVPVTASLTAYRGKRITIEFSTAGSAALSGKWAMYEFPQIELSLQQDSQPHTTAAVYSPENTELSPDLATGRADLNLEIYPEKSALTGHGHNIEPLPADPSGWMLGEGGNFQLQTPIDACLADYSDFSITLGVSPEVSPRYIHVILGMEGQSKREFSISLYPDGKTHTYTYPLRLLQLSPANRLHNFQIFFPFNTVAAAKVNFQKIQLIQPVPVQSDGCGANR
jgi:hypothetical protein